MIKIGTNVKSKIHDDLTGHVVVCEPINNYAVVMTDIMDYEMMTVAIRDKLLTAINKLEKARAKQPTAEW